MKPLLFRKELTEIGSDSEFYETKVQEYKDVFMNPELSAKEGYIDGCPSSATVGHGGGEK